MTNFIMGSDPEFIVSRDGEVVPYLEMEPINIEGFVEIHADNVLLEMNVNIAGTKKEFIDIHRESMKVVREFIKKEFNLELTNLNHYDFGKIRHPLFKTFGCAPSFNLYDKNAEFENPKSNVRYCGGHIHIGIDGDEDFYRSIIRNCDYYIGLNLDEQPSDRRKYYGKAGEYRFDKDLKVEYRTPANDWCFDNEEWIYDQTQKAVNDAVDGIIHDFDETEINLIKTLTC